ncbi:MAG: hypothetical protein F4Y25_03795 [Chloroflexi bacterium]|nr:hypothetical protein [Chloroflexota bacterium]
MEKLKDILANLVHVGGKPVPFIFAGLVVGLLNEHLESFTDTMAAIAATVLAASGMSLIILPPLLCLKRWADNRYREDVKVWPAAWITGLVLLTLWAVFWIRFSQ